MTLNPYVTTAFAGIAFSAAAILVAVLLGIRRRQRRIERMVRAAAERAGVDVPAEIRRQLIGHNARAAHICAEQPPAKEPEH